MIDPLKPPDAGAPMAAVRPGDSPEVIELCWQLRKLQTAIEKVGRRRVRLVAEAEELQGERRALRQAQEAGDAAARERRAELYRSVEAKIKALRKCKRTCVRLQRELRGLSRKRDQLRSTPTAPRPSKPSRGLEPVVIVRRRR